LQFLLFKFQRFDKFEDFQVSNVELKKFSASYDVEVCLVNALSNLMELNVILVEINLFLKSAYLIVEAIVGIVNF
jgi:hypothetical protein